MILHVNCIANLESRASFDENVVPRLSALAGGPIRSVPLDGELPGPTDFTHLVMNGSELSAAKDHPQDGSLIATIRAFADAGRPILGICYGHQMIARAFGGECRRAAEPEFGWKTVELESSPHFEGIEPPFVSAHSHFDEVPAPPPGFEVIARTDRCAVQAMATDGILSIQFHPEMTWERGQAMFADNVATGAVAAEDLSNDLHDPAEVRANDRIFTNFFGVNP